jgi:hypothetical protein
VVSPSLPAEATEYQIPDCILQHRMSPGDRLVLQVLVKWSGVSEALATWEDLEALRRRFPSVSTWGQVVSQEGGNVSSSTTDGHADEESSAGPRPMRAVKPNKNVCGPQWGK